MAFRESGQAEAIATEWGVNVDLLAETEWDVETIDGNDGEHYGYFVRFNQDTDPDILAQLGVAPGELYREVSINAFDEPDANDDESDDGIYSIDEPLPDISDFIEDDFEIQEPSKRPTNERRAYYISDERFTPSQFKKLSRRRKIEVMVQWFHENFEDPAVRLPYESAEGGYQWIWGGPYDAREQLSDQFSDIADENFVEEAVEEVTSEGLLDWAPKARREDYASDEDFNESGADEDHNQSIANEDYTKTALRRTDNPPPGEAYLTDSTGSVLTDSAGNRLTVNVPGVAATGSTFSNFTFAEATFAPSTDRGVAPGYLQTELLSRLESLEAALETYRNNLPPRNHNRPPELVEPDPITPSEVRIVVELAIELRQEAQQAQPDPVKLEAQASTLRKVASSILMWIAKKADVGVDTAIKAGVTAAIGTAWMLAAPEKVYTNLIAVAELASTWAQHILTGW